MGSSMQFSTYVYVAGYFIYIEFNNEHLNFSNE